MKREELKDVSFDSLGISPGLLARLQKLGFKHPTPIQYKAIPSAIKGEDVMGIAQTGSGKTLAFSIPMLERVSKTGKIGLVLLPTRELAVQVEETLHKVVEGAGLRTALVIGGTNPRPQIKKLKARPHVIVATPGRLLDHMEQGHVSLGHVGTLVLDEADRMLDMGFAPQLNKIMKQVPNKRHTMLFSATMPKSIVAMAKKYMQTPVRIEVAPAGTTADKIDQEMIMVPRDQKFILLETLLQEHAGSTLVFTRTKHGAKKLARALRRDGFTADEMHSNRSQSQRQKALKAFAAGSVRILVATDIAARGIDVKDIKLVINYDLPEQLEDYVHRIGRTGRAGKSGKAISFVAPNQMGSVKKIERMIKLSLKVKTHTNQVLHEPTPRKETDSQNKRTHPRRRKRNHRPRRKRK